MTRKNILSVLLITFFSFSSLFSNEKIFWNISTYTSSKNKNYTFKEKYGPYDSKETAIANWIYFDLKNDDEYAITNFYVENKTYKEQNIISKNPEATFGDIYKSITQEFQKDRYNAMNKYKIVPVDKIEKKYNRKNNKFVKKIHPREYLFDIFDISQSVFLKFDGKVFSSVINFTELVKNDLPQKNDKITIFYSGKTSNVLNQLTIELYTKRIEYDKKTKSNNIYDQKLDSMEIVSSANKKDKFEGSVTFYVDQDCKNEVFIKIINNVTNDPKKIDQTSLTFNRVIHSTNTLEEEKAEKRAEQKKIEIVEVKNEVLAEEIATNEELKKAELLEEQKRESERIESERIQREKEKIEAEKIEKERLEKQLQLSRIQQEELEKTLEQVTKQTNVSRYEKEYLQDFEDDYYYTSQSKKTRKTQKVLIENPNETDASGKTLLMKAARSGNDWQIKALIEAGADVNIQDKDGWTALMYAVRYQENLSAVSLLLKAGADPYLENNFRTSALTIATCYNDNPDVLKQILKYYEPSNKDVLKSLTMLFVSSQPSEFTQLAKLDEFIQKAVPLNTYYEGKTPLMFACQYGNSTEIIKVLLENNAAVTLRSSEGKTAFDYASKNLNLEHDDTYWSLNRKR